MPYDPQRHGPVRVVGAGFHERVFRVVSRVPPGFVTTYADVAEALGLRRAARQVGYALAALPANRRDVPWFRVVQSRGRVADGRDEQIERLRRDGVRVAAGGRLIDFRDIRVPVDLLIDHATPQDP